jgi:hypothetical protein
VSHVNIAQLLDFPQNSVMKQCTEIGCVTIYLKCSEKMEPLLVVGKEASWGCLKVPFCSTIGTRASLFGTIILLALQSSSNFLIIFVVVLPPWLECPFFEKKLNISKYNFFGKIGKMLFYKIILFI